uniref:Unclassified n=1 Tax=Fusarium pseudograminearum CS5834 TaxID=1318459 RepID=W1I9E5_FUSPS|nr:unclassified [Fusarium pseudograminearum CS5834]CDX48228.1 unclassified [Fusarium pseudograminearum CS5834]
MLIPKAKPSNCGKHLKLFQPNHHGNIDGGTGNDSWYGKIEIENS